MSAAPASPKISISSARAMTRLLITHHLGSKPKRIAAQGGMTNFVFLVNHAQGDLVVRISRHAVKLNAYIKEQWAIARVKELNVPTPEILEVGNEVIPYPYMILKRVAGEEATSHPRRLEILREVGRYAAIINSIRTTGFGSTFDWSNNQLSKNDSWDDFLEKELAIEDRLETLKKQKILTRPQLRNLSSILRGLGKSSIKPTLNHGDLRLKNILVNDKAAISAIIDWENCMSNIAPYWDLSLALHDLSVDQKEALLEGYGVKFSEIREMNPILRALNIINYVPKIERLVERKDSTRLEQYRIRLSGALDLYCI
jgi:aminoglycoside phosphotransferase (APT) family kinase protein